MDDLVNVNFDSEISKREQPESNPQTIIAIKKDLNHLFEM